MNSIATHYFDAVEVRTVVIDDQPYFCARDVADVLGYSDSRSIFDKIPAKWKGVQRLDTPGGKQDILCLSEHGLFFFLNRSDKPKAFPFQEWVAEKVLPTIRRTGSFSIVKDMTGGFPVPRSYAEALRLAADQAERIESMRPKVESADALLRCDRTMSITDAAKHFALHPNTQVFPYLRVRGLLTEKNLPTQDAIDAGILSVRQNRVADADFRPQAVVMASQLERWRTWLVPKIVAWSTADMEVTHAVRG